MNWNFLNSASWRVLSFIGGWVKRSFCQNKVSLLASSIETIEPVHYLLQAPEGLDSIIELVFG